MARRVQALPHQRGAYAAMKAAEARALAPVEAAPSAPEVLAPIQEQAERVRVSAERLADALKGAQRAIPLMRPHLMPLSRLVSSVLVRGVYENDHWPELLALLAPAIEALVRVVPLAVGLAPPEPRGSRLLPELESGASGEGSGT